MAQSSGESDVRESSEALPTFDITSRYDDAANPAELTVFSAADDERTTAWLTIDVAHAVPIEAVR